MLASQKDFLYVVRFAVCCLPPVSTDMLTICSTWGQVPDKYEVHLQHPTAIVGSRSCDILYDCMICYIYILYFMPKDASPKTLRRDPKQHSRGRAGFVGTGIVG